jgi:hypothetical protein
MGHGLSHGFTMAEPVSHLVPDPKAIIFSYDPIPKPYFRIRQVSRTLKY